MSEIKLVLPDIKYKDSFLSAILEFRALKIKRSQDEKYAVMDENMSDEDFAEYVNRLLNKGLGLGLKPGRSRTVTYWIVDRDGFVGARRIRPEIDDTQAQEVGHVGVEIRPSKRGRGYQRQSMRLTLEKCAQMGLGQICVSCDADNVHSKKNIIEMFNEYGGHGCGGDDTRYYCWLNTSKKK